MYVLKEHDCLTYVSEWLLFQVKRFDLILVFNATFSNISATCISYIPVKFEGYALHKIAPE